MLIAHRGKVSYGIKENSLEAFLGAIYDKKYDGFELDIRMSKDKEIVICHDFFYNNKIISNTNYKELKEMGILKLEDVLNIKFDKLILIEIKDYNMDLVILNKLLNKYKNKNIYIVSFYNNIIKKYMELNYYHKCGILHYVFNREYSYSEYDFVCLINSLITDNVLDYFKKKKIEVFSYGVIGNLKDCNKDIYYIIDNNQEKCYNTL